MRVLPFGCRKVQGSSCRTGRLVPSPGRGNLPRGGGRKSAYGVLVNSHAGAGGDGCERAAMALQYCGASALLRKAGSTRRRGSLSALQAIERDIGLMLCWTGECWMG